MNKFKQQQHVQKPVSKTDLRKETHTALDEESVTAHMTARPQTRNRAVMFSISGVFVP